MISFLEIYRTCAMKSVDDERIKRISQNITSMENTLVTTIKLLNALMILQEEPQHAHTTNI